MLKISQNIKETPVSTEEIAPSYDASVLPYNNRVRTSAAKLDENLRSGQQALLRHDQYLPAYVGDGPERAHARRSNRHPRAVHAALGLRTSRPAHAVAELQADHHLRSRSQPLW